MCAFGLESPTAVISRGEKNVSMKMQHEANAKAPMKMFFFIISLNTSKIRIHIGTSVNMTLFSLRTTKTAFKTDTNNENPKASHTGKRSNN